MMKKIKDIAKAAWKRLTSSKVAWMSVPTALLPFVYILTGKDSLPEWFVGAWAALWTLLGAFIGTNDPTNGEDF